MKLHLFVVVGLWFLLIGCMVAAPIAEKVSPTSTGSSTVTIPNLFGMKKEQALAELKRVGHQGSVREEGSLCGSITEGRIIELGEVCYQHPAPGRVTGARLPISVRVQTEDPRHGNIGRATEWHLMPDVRNMSVEQARRVLHDHGLTTQDKTSVQYVGESGCASGKICRTYPEGMKRIGLNSTRILYVGRESGAR